MITSPGEPVSCSRWIVSSTGAPAGIINQKTRGALNFWPRSSRLLVPVAPLAASTLTASGDRSKTATWWPPWSSRSVIPAPMRPRPISPSCIASPGECRERRADSLADLLQAGGHVAQLDPQHAATMIAQRLKIAERLRLLQDAERESLAGNIQILRVVPDDLKENPGVRAALVQLAGRVQIARSVANCGGDPMLVADRQPDGIQRPVVLRGGLDIREQGHVIAGV